MKYLKKDIFFSYVLHQSQIFRAGYFREFHYNRILFLFYRSRVTRTTDNHVLIKFLCIGEKFKKNFNFTTIEQFRDNHFIEYVPPKILT